MNKVQKAEMKQANFRNLITGCESMHKQKFGGIPASLQVRFVLTTSSRRLIPLPLI